MVENTTYSGKILIEVEKVVLKENRKRIKKSDHLDQTYILKFLIKV